MKRKFGAEYKALLSLGLPVLVTQLGIIVVSFADTMMVGRYGTAELAASAFVNSIFLVVAVMLIGFAAGLTPLIGALYSRADYQGAGRVLKAGLAVNGSLAVAFTFIMGILYFFLDCLGQPEELLPLIRPYYLTVLSSLLPMAIYNACQQTANGSTNTRMPMWIMLGGNVWNIIGNYLLIYGKFGFPEMGLLGAGISTLTARWGMCLVILMVIFRAKRYREYVKGVGERLQREVCGKVWRTSYPVMIQNGVECALWTVGAVVCGEFGTVQLAGYQIVNTIGQLGFMIYMSFSTAVSIRVANYTGLEDTDGVRRATSAGLRMNLLLGTLASLAFIFFGEALIDIFTTDEAVVASAMGLILPLVVYQYGDAVQLNYANALRGMGEVKPLQNISIISYIIVGVPALLLLANVLGLENVGIYYSYSFPLFTASLLLSRAYFKKVIG